MPIILTLKARLAPIWIFFLGLIILACLVGVSIAADICQPGETGVKPNPDNCATYFSCLNGETHELR